jgi:hypothetical protein
MNKIGNRTKIIAPIAIFSALYAVLRIMQTIPMIGAQGASFSLSDVLAPLYGIILGPYVGGASVILGTFLGMAMGKPVVFLGLDFLPALVNAVVLGFLVRRKWAPVVVLNAALLLTFVLYPVTSVFVNIPVGNTTYSLPFVWLHIVAFVVLVSPLGRRAGQWVSTLKPSRITAGLVVLAFVGTMMQHLMGNILFETVLAQPIGYIPTVAYSGIWTSIFLVYPFERLALVVLAVVVGAPLIRVLKKSFFNDSKPQDPKVTQQNAQ